MKKLQHTVSLGLFLLLLACGQRPAAGLPEVSPVLPGVSVFAKIEAPALPFSLQPESFTLNAGKSSEIITARGSKILIPEDAFTYADGSPLTEPVQLELKEAHSQAEIMLMGVRMTYNVGGKECPFESAGMIDIKGKSRSGKEVRIRKGKQLTLKVRSAKPDNDYNFYRFDKVKGEWMEEAQALDPEKEEPAPEKTLRTAGFNEPVYDFKVDVSNVDRLNGYFGVMWQAATPSKRFDRETEKQLTATRWDRIEVVSDKEKAGKYELRFLKGQTKIMVDAVPVLRGNAKQSLQKAVAQDKQKSNNATFMRTARVSEFGLYNCDRYIQNNEAVLARATLSFRGLQTLPPAFNVYHLVDSRIILPLNPDGAALSFNYVPSEANRLVAVSADGAVWSVRGSDFNRATAEAAKLAFTFAKESNVKDADALQQFLLSI